MKRVFALSVLALTCITGGCGNVTPSNSGDAGIDAPLTAAEACGQLAGAICDAVDGCAHVYMQLLYGDKTTCISRQQLSCMDDQMVSGTNNTPAIAASCAQAIHTATCADLLASKIPAACQIQPGTVANGLACGSSWQCQSTHCEKNGQQCGICGPRAAAGGTCTVDDGCQVGMVCASGKCVTPGELGAGCDATHPCRGNLYCPGTDATTTNPTCAHKLGATASCATTADACDLAGQHVACNPFTKVCVDVGVAQGGQACGNVNGTFTVCVDFDDCAGATLTVAGTCAAPAMDGEFCGANKNPGHNCIPPATCDSSGVCRLPSSTSCN
jgi:hypothetical protein